jgi:hypothetical protein
MKKLETLCRSYIAEQLKTHCLLINSKSFLPLQATSSSTTHVLISLLPAEVEYAILDPDIVRKCKFTVKENTSHLVYPSVDKEVDDNDTCRLHFGLVYIFFYCNENLRCILIRFRLINTCNICLCVVPHSSSYFFCHSECVKNIR